MSNPLRCSDTLLIGWEGGKNDGDIPILIVGRKGPGETVDIINAFQGQKAEELYSQLLKKEEKKS